MKKALLGALLILTMFLAPLPSYADDTPRVFLDGQEMAFDVQPVIVDGRVLVPFSKIFSSLGYSVFWIKPDTVMVGSTGEYLWMKVGDYSAWAGQKNISLDVPAQIVDGRVMIPLRVLAEAGMCAVSYDNSNNLVEISTGNKMTLLDVCRGAYSADAARYSQLKSECNINADCIKGIANFESDTNKEVEFDWYHIDGSGNKELKMVESKKITQITSSILKKDYYELGNWVLEAKVNGKVMQVVNFTITNTDIYRTISWLNGKYTGYMYNGQPYEYGKLNLNGTIIEGRIQPQTIAHCYTESLEPGGTIDLSNTQISTVDGVWSFPDGSRFVGILQPVLVAKTQGDVENNHYSVYSEIWGQYTSPGGQTRRISGYYEGYEPGGSFSFGQQPIINGRPVISGKVYDAISSHSLGIDRG